MLDFARSLLKSSPSSDASTDSESAAQADGEEASDAPAPISSEQVEHLARLAQLELSEEERASLGEDLRRLVAYAEQLGEVDTAGVEPMPPGAPAVPEHLRTDDPEKPLSQKEALENAPDADEKGFFRTPSAIE